MTDDDDMVTAIPGGSRLKEPPVIRGGGHYNNIGEMKRSSENGAVLHQFKKMETLAHLVALVFTSSMNIMEKTKSFLPSHRTEEQRKKKISLE